MKFKYFIFFFLLLGFFKQANSLSPIVVDIPLCSALTTYHIMQMDVLERIHNKEEEIIAYESAITIKLQQIKNLEEKVHNYLKTVNEVVKQGKDVIYASQIAMDIKKYQTEAARLAQSDPKLMLVVAKTEYELITRTADLFVYIYSFALKGGENNLLDNKQRIDFCIHVVDQLRKMRALAYSVCRQIKYAKSAGILTAMNPRTFKFQINDKGLVGRIVKDIVKQKP